jgi:hypothetical protein
MIDLFLKVIDRLIQLAKLQEKRLGVRFSQIYTSTFSELEEVHRDYLLMFDDLQALLRDIPENAKPGNKKAEAALKWFEKRRRELAPVRQKLLDFERVVRPHVQSPHTSSLRAEECEFLKSVYLYFHHTGDVFTEGARGSGTASASLLKDLKEALSASPGGHPITLKQVRAQCERVIADHENRWRKAVATYNDLRFSVAQHSS